MKWKFATTVLAAAMVVAGGNTAGAEYPTRPVKLVVPFEPGGATDILARVLQKTLQSRNLLKQPLTVINVAGAGGSIGARQVKDDKPDGYTLLLHHTGLLMQEASGMSDFGYRDFAPIASLGEYCLIPAVMEDSPYPSLEILLKKAKETPDTITWGGNLGANNHMAILALEAASPGSVFRKVQVGGGAKSFAALKGKVVETIALGPVEYQGFKAAGVKALAYLGSSRHPNEPNLPTARELGFDATYCISHVLYAPKGTPSTIIDAVAKAASESMQDPEMGKQLDKLGVAPTCLVGNALSRQLTADFEITKPLALQAAKKP